MINKSYVRHTVQGVCINPVTKDNPVVNRFPSRALRRRVGKGRPFSNKKGIQVIVVRTGATEFMKYHRRVQVTKPGWSIPYFDEKSMTTKNANEFRHSRGIAQTFLVN